MSVYLDGNDNVSPANTNITLSAADETVNQNVVLHIGKRRQVELYATAAAATTFNADVSDDGSTWIQGWMSWASVTAIPTATGFESGFAWVRLRSNAAGVAGNTVTLYIAAS